MAGASGAAAGPPSAPAEPLDILLTNDDGWNAPGIQAVYTALTEAGHHVTMVAPDANQSGVGAAATFGGSLTLTRHSEHQYSVSGKPSDAARVGLSVLFADAPPDLVISGTNSGQNLGSNVIASGTVGAAATALNSGVPAIAISTEFDFTNPTAPLPFDDTADWLVALLDGLRSRAHGGSIQPAGIGLNVNYPVVGSAATGFADPAGVVWPATGLGGYRVTYSGGVRSRSTSRSASASGTTLLRSRSRTPTRPRSRTTSSP